MGPDELTTKTGVHPRVPGLRRPARRNTSDNIPGVPGVGRNRGASSSRSGGRSRNHRARGPTSGASLKETSRRRDRLGLNEQLARIVTDLDLDIRPEDCVRGPSDPDAVHRLHVARVPFAARPAQRGGQRDASRRWSSRSSTSPSAMHRRLATVFQAEASWVRLQTDEGRVRGAAVSAGGGAEPAYGGARRVGALAEPLEPPQCEVGPRRQGAGADRARGRRNGRRGGLRHDARRVPAAILRRPRIRSRSWGSGTWAWTW